MLNTTTDQTDTALEPIVSTRDAIENAIDKIMNNAAASLRSGLELSKNYDISPPFLVLNYDHDDEDGCSGEFVFEFDLGINFDWWKLEWARLAREIVSIDFDDIEDVDLPEEEF